MHRLSTRIAAAAIVAAALILVLLLLMQRSGGRGRKSDGGVGLLSQMREMHELEEQLIGLIAIEERNERKPSAVVQHQIDGVREHAKGALLRNLSDALHRNFLHHTIIHRSAIVRRHMT